MVKSAQSSKVHHLVINCPGLSFIIVLFCLRSSHIERRGRLVLLLKTNIRTVIYFEYASARDRPSWAYMPRAFVPGVELGIIQLEDGIWIRGKSRVYEGGRKSA